jgi:hypothetical protein
MTLRFVPIGWVGAVSLAVATIVSAATPAVGAPKVGSHSIGGTVMGDGGPEAGVWVIAETSELGNPFTKIVVTDDQGRFVLPDMPQAKFKVWARGYGLSDSQPVDASPGTSVSLKASKAPSAAAAAQIYPANYWFSLIHIPAASEFPGTGPHGNGIAPAMRTQEEWITHMKENCQFCHQLGTLATRQVADIGNPVEAWSQRTQKDRSPDDVFFEGSTTHLKRNYGQRMTNLMTLFGRDRGLAMYADWTTRIGHGELPSAAPARPAGVERNVVITMRNIADGHFLHDSISTDKRNPTVNAGGPLYATAQFAGEIVALDFDGGKQHEFKLSDYKGAYAENANDHTDTMDSKGRIWMTLAAPQGDNPGYCVDPQNKFAQYFPRDSKVGRVVTVLDPKTGKNEVIPVCFGTHHLNFDSHDRVYFSGDTEVVGWVDTQVWDKTKDPAKSVGWCPMVLDTNGDGKITPDRTHWNSRMEGIGGGEGADLRAGDTGTAGVAGLDPQQDTRIAGFNYGMAVSPKDQSYWAAKYSPIFPSGIVRIETGTNPPTTCKTEYYEAPKVNGKYSAYNARGVDVDANGIAWVAFGTGAIGRFDRSKCKVGNGPTATGQQCPEGWEIIDTPSPKLAGTQVGSDWFYLVFVDHHTAFGLGAEVPIFPNSVGDEMLAYLAKEKKFVHLRVPYPLGFYARGVDGRIDDEKAGWKGRGLWASNNVIPLWHQENGEGSTETAVHFQLRPSPLAE